MICHENDRSDSLYIIRGGLVKVVKNDSALLAVADVRDWNKLTTLLREGSQAAGHGRLGPIAVETARPGRPGPAEAGEPATLFARGAAGGGPRFERPDQEPRVARRQGTARTGRLPHVRRGERRPADWPDRELRAATACFWKRRCPRPFTVWKPSKGPSTILSFQGQGEFFGEMGLLLKRPRTRQLRGLRSPAARGNGSGPGVVKQQGDLVEMVRIPEKTFWTLVEANPALRTKVEKELARHQKADVQRRKERIWDEPSQVQASDRFVKLGLVQGQRLMLIDLDRCTRCDECVKACVHTHSDGRSRLFLDGLRFGKYLVPTTCRSCLEPVCMIGCPVGSIHRGDNREIVIEDWCIGCGLCARNCPYGSIQMHDLALVPSEARDWLFCPPRSVPDSSWTQPGYRDAHWLTGKAPFFDDRDLHELLQHPWRAGRAGGGRRRPGVSRSASAGSSHLSKEAAQQAKEFKLEVTSTDESASVWINGKEIETRERSKAGRPATSSLPRTKGPPGRSQRSGRSGQAAAGQGRAAVRSATGRGSAGAASRQASRAITRRAVTAKLAVVCDLCSEQFGKRPACVNACPHDAAMRVDARFEFPEQ